MIFEFLLPIIGWLIVFGICFLIYTNIFYKKEEQHTHVEGQALYTALAAFFWITVYMCLSSIWSILYSLIDLKYPDVVGAVSDYGNSGFVGSGAVFDAFAFPLAMTIVSAVTACVLAFFLIKKFNDNKNLRPKKLYDFLRAIVFIGGAILAFSGFVYVVYSWLYGNLPIAVLYKGIVAFVIVGSTALYFHLIGSGNNPKESMISRVFAVAVVLATLATLYISFQVIGTPAEARKFRLDSITLQNLQNVKYNIDNMSSGYNIRIKDFSELNDDYSRRQAQKSEARFTNMGEEYKLCADFNADMPMVINNDNRDTSWDYKQGESCFTFKFPKSYNTQGPVVPVEKPVYIN